MIEVAGWALVAGCLLVNGPDCNGHLATGIVWGDPAGCNLEMKREQIPGAQCMAISGIEAPSADAPLPGADEVIRMLNDEVSDGEL